ncbi:MAG: DNA gyrase subunit A [Holosporales bacterium]|jgi:DNA gyrase subunit A
MSTLTTTADNPELSIEDEMRKSYLDYAMSVIVSRALPDVRDGLKPVHRRILYAMKEGGYDSTKPLRKSARIIGDVMGKYHPHGDTAIYDALVRMAQDFSLRLPLIQGQGNFGSMDGDNPAAMRYTEARLAKAAEELLRDIDKNTVDFRPNYDDSEREPMVLPAQFPNLLVNGVGGIAVGMATNIPPHNLGEVIDACCAYVDNPALTLEEVMQFVQGPDFPTGGLILGRKGILDAFKTGRGSILMRAKHHLETHGKDRQSIIFDTIPYQQNKAKIVEKIGDLIKEKIVEGIAEVRDESDRDGVRVVVDLKRDIEPEVILNKLFSLTPLETSFGVNTVALHNGRPATMGLLSIIAAFVTFREEVIGRRTRFELMKARERAHILVGLAVAVANIDEVIRIIRAAPNPETARAELIKRDWPAEGIMPLVAIVDPGVDQNQKIYRLSETQAKAILDLRLHRLTGLEREKITGELKEVGAAIGEYLTILNSRPKMLEVLKQELLTVKEKFSTPRRTDIVGEAIERDMEDLIQREDMVVTVSFNGYVKRVSLSSYRAQKRGGKGRSAMTTREEDFVTRLFIANTHTPVLFFTSAGRVYLLKTYALPQGTPQTRGKPLVQLLPKLEGNERVSAIMPLPDDATLWDKMSILFATSKGNIRRNALTDFTSIKTGGKMAMKLEESGESLVDVVACHDHEDVVLSTKMGRTIRFALDDLRVFNSRASTGVRGVRLAKGDEVINLSTVCHVDMTMEERAAYRAEAARRRGLEVEEADPEDVVAAVSLSKQRFDELAAQEEFMLTVSNLGFGKRSSLFDYRLTGRGGQGIAAMELNAKNGQMIATFPVKDTDQIMLVTNNGQLIRCPVDQIRIAGRKTQGVTIFKVASNEQVVAVAKVPAEEE